MLSPIKVHIFLIMIFIQFLKDFLGILIINIPNFLILMNDLEKVFCQVQIFY